jgi:alanyl-tRNA synthetase
LLGFIKSQTKLLLEFKSVAGNRSRQNLTLWRQDVSTTVRAIMTMDGFVDTTAGLEEDTTVGLVLDATSFYAEQGGQIFDTGSVVTASGVEFAVTGCKVAAGFVLHTGSVSGTIVQVKRNSIHFYKSKSLRVAKQVSIVVYNLHHLHISASG